MNEYSIDPKYSQFHLDTCAFDPKYSPEDEAARRIWALYESGVLSLILAHSNQVEIDHPNTPPSVKAQAEEMIFTIPVQLTPHEELKRGELETLLKGDATSDKHRADAHHIFDASKHGGYFVTTDKRILGLAEEILQTAQVQVLKPSEDIERLILP